ncbi:CbtA family protein [Labrys sp. KNU-23]|uniref:CbtA family protein n=1 Tax=Labrys sp. KNU-23 TaxID=2789216 RepID=UPI0011EEF848|nr:CbtA family protein [Labrys sp. KNU-23]QEN88352.1 CbtA family protein [Labrys sp. KNU-23]
MVRSLLIRGMLIGILAGLLASGFAWVFGEPQVDAAIAYEESHAAAAAPAPSAAPATSQPAAAHEHEQEDPVSRPVQSSYGLMTGMVAYGAALGGIFALVFAFAQGRIGTLSPRATAGLIALVGFAAIMLVPQIKYPATPPAVGNPDTIGLRTAFYFGMILLSLATMAAALGTANRLAASLGRWNANLVGAAAYLVVMVIAMQILPAVNDIPADFSATVLWKFRIASLGIHAVLWATLGIAFGVAAQRLVQTSASR